MEQKTKDYFVLIEQDEDGMYVGEVSQLTACYSQGQTLDELMTNIQEVMNLCMEKK
ncbi:MAG: type II toxin-antitoxin system HicB family antitoxin [Anaerolineae bacterium]